MRAAGGARGDHLPALAVGVHVILEKPFTGCFAAADTPRAEMEAAAVASARRTLAAERASSATLGCAENWVFAPAVQKEAEIVRKTGAQLLRLMGEASHSGVNRRNTASGVTPEAAHWWARRATR